MWDTTGESDLQDADRLGNICRVTSVALFTLQEIDFLQSKKYSARMCQDTFFVPL